MAKSSRVQQRMNELHFERFHFAYIWWCTKWVSFLISAQCWSSSSTSSFIKPVLLLNACKFLCADFGSISVFTDALFWNKSKKIVRLLVCWAQTLFHYSSKEILFAVHVPIVYGTVLILFLWLMWILISVFCYRQFCVESVSFGLPQFEVSVFFHLYAMLKLKQSFGSRNDFFVRSFACAMSLVRVKTSIKRDKTNGE